MFRPASRFLTQRSLAFRTSTAASSRRLLSTAPPAQKSRSWKNSALRWGLAVGGVYYYSISNVFAEEPIYSVAKHPEAQDEPGDLPTLDSVAAERRKRSLSNLTPGDEQSPIAENEASIVQDIEEAEQGTAPQTAQEYEDEAGQQGAFNPETGEINWDCPCLGGMAHGPCGEEFKKAFSCFVYSKEEPKGMDCVEHFKTMQGCFREHPDIYGGELDEDEEGQAQEPIVDGESVEAGTAQALPPPPPPQPQASSEQLSQPQETSPTSPHLEASPTRFSVNGDHKRTPPSDDATKERVRNASKQVKEEHPPMDESDELVPKAAHDARSKNEGK